MTPGFRSTDRSESVTLAPHPTLPDKYVHGCGEPRALPATRSLAENYYQHGEHYFRLIRPPRNNSVRTSRMATQARIEWVAALGGTADDEESFSNSGRTRLVPVQTASRSRRATTIRPPADHHREVTALHPASSTSRSIVRSAIVNRPQPTAAAGDLRPTQRLIACPRQHRTAGRNNCRQAASGAPGHWGAEMRKVGEEVRHVFYLKKSTNPN